MDESTIGANIRRMREAAGLTVTAVARDAQLTKSTLSKIENGRVSSPIATLMRIADAMGVPVAEFFTEPRKEPDTVFTPRGQGKVITQDGTRFGYAYEALALERSHKLADPFLLTIQPTDPQGEFRHGGEEFLYMVSGHVRATVGDKQYYLKPGDSLYFDPNQIHFFQALRKKQARFLCLLIHKEHPVRGKARKKKR